MVGYSEAILRAVEDPCYIPGIVGEISRLHSLTPPKGILSVIA